ncbi:MAG: gas vesicle protein [Candidatus Rokubacteria bacterium]|nr:gas vesicle protein [Candidatus Rokubacteria bacterium]
MSRTTGPGDPEDLLQEADASLLDLLDNLLNRGVVLNGEVMLSIANVDLVYLRLSVLLCAADRIFPASRSSRQEPRHGPRHRKSR